MERFRSERQQGMHPIDGTGMSHGLAHADGSLTLRRFWTSLKNHVGAMGQRRTRRLTLVETLSLGEKRQLFIVKCGSRELLVGGTGNFLGTLAVLEDPINSGGGER